jgi:hypothetical protein
MARVIDPNDYWVNNPLIKPMNKAMFYDRDIWVAKMDEQDRVIDIFREASGHNGKTHYEGSDCWFCKAIEGLNDY